MKRQLPSAIEIIGERGEAQNLGEFKIETVEATPDKFAVSPE